MGAERDTFVPSPRDHAGPRAALRDLRVDPDVIAVAGTLERLCTAAKSTPAKLFRELVRRALDEVIDGPRTGRFQLQQLEKTEKTYVGTKVEIIVRAALELDRGTRADVMVGTVPVDIKWSQDLQWMIGKETVGTVCLGRAALVMMPSAHDPRRFRSCRATPGFRLLKSAQVQTARPLGWPGPALVINAR